MQGMPLRIVFVIGWLLFSTPAQSSEPILILETMDVPVVKKHTQGFINRIEELKAQSSLAKHPIKTLNGHGDRKALQSQLEAALKQDPPALILSNATMASQVAYEQLKGSNIPIVFVCVADPVGAGLISQIGTPTQSNITGLVFSLPRENKLKMARRIVEKHFKGKTLRLGVIHSDYPSAIGDLKLLREAIDRVGSIKLITHQIKFLPDDQKDVMIQQVAHAAKQLSDQVDFFWEPVDGLSVHPQYTKTILSTSDKPVLYGSTLNAVQNGALFYVSPDPEKSGAEAADLVHMILNKQSPGALAPHHPKSVFLGLNVATAKKLGIVFPYEFLKLAGSHLYGKNQ